MDWKPVGIYNDSLEALALIFCSVLFGPFICLRKRWTDSVLIEQRK